MSFKYKGIIPASKSILNRCLVAQSFTPDLNLLGDSTCDDVVHMRRGLRDLLQGHQPIDCGAAGTVLRFLTFRASRMPGEHVINGSERLLSRPLEPMVEALDQLQVSLKKKNGRLLLHSKGWQAENSCIVVDRSKSSQFASGILLSAWGLDFPLRIEWVGESISDGYWQMTVDLLKALGMEIKSGENYVEVPSHQIVTSMEYRAESDLSSAFAVAAVAAVSGQAIFDEFPWPSLQPDAVFVDILKRMGVPIEYRDGALTVERAQNLKPVEWNLSDCPDLFPVLSVLCALADGTSRLYGAPHLAYKESNRLEKSAELVRKMGRQCRVFGDGMEIDGVAKAEVSEFLYDTDEDHRLAFAAAVAKKSGVPVSIMHPQVVNKSFPEFWQVIGTPL